MLETETQIFDPNEHKSDYGKFGRLKLLDKRSLDHPMSRMLRRKTSVRRSYHKRYKSKYHYDQGNYPYCTAYSLLHYFELEPVTHSRVRGHYKGYPKPVYDPRELYCLAQQKDPWPGGCGAQYGQDSYDGTSVTAMMQVAKEKGIISEYGWEYRNIDVVVEALLTKGPVIIGVDWYDGMMLPPKRNGYREEEALLLPTGGIVGGHATVIDEVNLTKARKGRELGVFQSWEDSWGFMGRGFMSLETAEKLMLADGEFCIATEIK